MTEPPKPFTGPISQYNKDTSIYIDPDRQKLYEAAMQKAVHHEKLTEEGLNKLQKEHSIEPNKRQNDKIHKYDAVIEITPEAIERL